MIALLRSLVLFGLVKCDELSAVIGSILGGEVGKNVDWIWGRWISWWVC